MRATSFVVIVVAVVVVAAAAAAAAADAAGAAATSDAPHAYEHDVHQQRRVPTRRWAAQLAAGVDGVAFARAHGLRHVHAFAFGNYHEFEFDATTPSRARAHAHARRRRRRRRRDSEEEEEEEEEEEDVDVDDDADDDDEHAIALRALEHEREHESAASFEERVAERLHSRLDTHTRVHWHERQHDRHERIEKRLYVRRRDDVHDHDDDDDDDDDDDGGGGGGAGNHTTHAKRTATVWNGWTSPPQENYAEQWHLHASAREFRFASGANIGPNAPNVNVEAAWRLGAFGAGATVAVVDDGVQKTHPDIAPNFQQSGSYDFNANRFDPRPDHGRKDDHGTPAAGVAAAAADPRGKCGVGVAPKAHITGVRLLGNMAFNDALEGRAFEYDVEQYNHILSNSWGPSDDGRTIRGPGRLAAAALEHARDNGRGGLGSLLVWAAGNGKSHGDSCNNDGYANLPYTLSFGSVDYKGASPWYSEGCAALLAVTPSSTGSTGLRTTDLLGADGKTPGDCCFTFGGTSASGPVGAGICALVLGEDTHHKFTYRDVEAIIIRASSWAPSVFDHAGRRGSAHAQDWQTNDAGFTHSQAFGFGLTDAGEAVKLARSWQPLPPQRSHVVDNTLATPLVLAGSKRSHTHAITVPPSANMTLEWALLRIRTDGGIARGKLEIDLDSPSGKCKSMLLEPRRSDYSRSPLVWQFTTLRCYGEGAAGEWRVTVRSSDTGASTKVISLRLSVLGH